jgi:hypothetical protein
MTLFLTTHPMNVIFQQATDDEKGVTQRNQNIFMGMIEVMVSIHHNLSAGYKEVDANRIETALTVMPVGLGNDDVAACDTVVSPLEVADCRKGGGSYLLVYRNVIETDLWFCLHGSSPAKS